MTGTRRNILLGGLIALSVVAAATGWFFGSRLRSPAEIAAQAEPPEPSNITVEVVRQVLSADVIVRGDVVYDQPVSLSLSGSFADPAAALVVTQAPSTDDELDEGDVAVVVSGRPVFLLTGEIPMYRDLRPGATGEDVLQVEHALSRLGYFDGVPDEEWDSATGVAVADWYAEAGFRSNGLSREDEAALNDARNRVRMAEAALAEAQTALTTVQQGPEHSALLAAEAEVTDAQGAASLARLDADRANRVANDAVNGASQELHAAEQTATRAANRLQQAENGRHPDTGSPPTSAELNELRQEARDTTSAVNESRTTLDAAKFEAERTPAEQRALVRQADQRVAIAKASLADLQSPADTSSLQGQAELASEELNAARSDRSDLEAELGTWLPAGEIIFLPRLPVRVDAVNTSRGSMVEGTLLTVSGSEVALQTSVLERDAPMVEVGMEVEIDDPDGGAPIVGVVTVVADRPGTNGVGADRVYIECLPETLPDGLIGSNVRVRIPVNSTGGEVLAVPAAALAATADGSTRVEVEQPDGSLRTVVVEPGLAAGGLVQVTPRDGDIDEGDLVVVGRESGD